MSFALWNRASSRRKRIISIVAVFIVATIVTGVGSLVPMDADQADQISRELNQTASLLESQGALTQFIFGNNFMICLFMFVPIIGPLFGLFVLFNSGTVIGAIATAEGFSPILALVVLFITPVAWLEFGAYSTAMAESVWLFRRFLQRRSASELRKTAVFVSICAVLLIVGAIVEVALLSISL
jgi:uncharacterized membrane protein SpoIIM required for sporulation